MKTSIEYIDQLFDSNDNCLLTNEEIANMFKEYAEQFIDAAAELCDSKYPAQNKESILNLKQLIK